MSKTKRTKDSAEPRSRASQGVFIDPEAMESLAGNPSSSDSEPNPQTESRTISIDHDGVFTFVFGDQKLDVDVGDEIIEMDLISEKISRELAKEIPEDKEDRQRINLEIDIAFTRAVRDRLSERLGKKIGIYATNAFISKVRELWTQLKNPTLRTPDFFASTASSQNPSHGQSEESCCG